MFRICQRIARIRLRSLFSNIVSPFCGGGEGSPVTTSSVGDSPFLISRRRLITSAVINGRGTLVTQQVIVISFKKKSTGPCNCTHIKITCMRIGRRAEDGFTEEVVSVAELVVGGDFFEEEKVVSTIF